MKLPPLPPLETIAERLSLVFPEGTSNRSYCIRDLAAKTVFSMLYIGAVEGSGYYLGPIHVYRMTNEQASRIGDEDRKAYRDNIRKKNFRVPGLRWYADNTREPIRDETLRDGLVNIGAVFVRDDLPTTSSRPRYAMKELFAGLFDPALKGDELTNAIQDFQTTHLSKSAQTRLSIIRFGAVGSADGVLVTFPSRETRMLAPGPSSLIARAVVEEFAPLYLERPAVLWLSESGKKVAIRDDQLANQIGISIKADRNLPDLILADIGSSEPLIVFVEVVATDGAVTKRRKGDLLKLTDEAGFPRRQVAFMTAYKDRESQGYRKTSQALAWGSFAWFLSEPQNILHMRDGRLTSTKLADLLETA